MIGRLLLAGARVRWPARSGQRGFTLLEVMVALGIMLLIATITWQTMAGTIAARDYLEEQSESERSIRVTLDRIERQLRLAFLTSNTSAVNTYRTVFVGQDNDPGDKVWFASMSHTRRYRDAHECDQTEITLWTEDDPENPGRMVLLERESQRIDEKPDEDGVISPLAHGLTRFDLRYLDGSSGEWLDEWDSTGVDTPNRLPRAVQIVLSVMRPDPDDPEDEIERPFVTTILIETANSATGGSYTPASGGAGGGAGGDGVDALGRTSGSLGSGGPSKGGSSGSGGGSSGAGGGKSNASGSGGGKKK